MFELVVRFGALMGFFTCVLLDKCGIIFEAVQGMALWMLCSVIWGVIQVVALSFLGAALAGSAGVLVGVLFPLSIAGLLYAVGHNLTRGF